MMALQRFVNRSSGLLGKTPDSSLEALGLTSICPSHYHRSLDSNACHGQRFVFRIATCLLAAGFPVTSCGGIIVDPAQSSMRRRDLQPTSYSLFRSTFMQDLARSSWPSICVIADASPKGKIDEPQLKHLLFRKYHAPLVYFVIARGLAALDQQRRETFLLVSSTATGSDAIDGSGIGEDGRGCQCGGQDGHEILGGRQGPVCCSADVTWNA